jgi:hypothetical protein
MALMGVFRRVCSEKLLAGFVLKPMLELLHRFQVFNHAADIADSVSILSFDFLNIETLTVQWTLAPHAASMPPPLKIAIEIPLYGN